MKRWPALSELYAYFGTDLVGIFRKDKGDRIAFEYVESRRLPAVSLCLPRDDEHALGAAAAYLDNLLPDDENVRARWAQKRGSKSTAPFDLLANYGEDVAGAIVLSPRNDLPARAPGPLIEATEDDIAARIAAIREESTSWFDPDVDARMSLAGAQGKFSLAKVGDRWFWPTYEQPSTHIFKPPAKEHKQIEFYENMGLEFAERLGLAASVSSHVDFLGQPTFMVERWDRWPSTLA